MKKTVFLIAQLCFLFACNRVVDTHTKQIEFSQLPKAIGDDLLIMHANNKYLVLTTIKSFNSNLKQWVYEHAYIKEDKELFEAVKHMIEKQSKNHELTILRADIEAKAKGLTERLEYRTSDLLRANKCFIYNKESTLVERKVIVFDDSDFGNVGHGFSVSNDTIMKVIDAVY